MRKLLLMLLSFTMVSLIAIGQSRTAFDLSGKVIANRDGDPVVGAFVYVEGSKNATSTDNAGHFSIKVLPSQKIYCLNDWFQEQNHSCRQSKQH